MSGLETSFYIIGIVFMGIMLILIFALLTAVLVIKAKVNKVHDAVVNKVERAKAVADQVSNGWELLRRLMRS
jgi:hypothetical protein